MGRRPAETSGAPTCRRCGRISMHRLDPDALCVERCAAPPVPGRAQPHSSAPPTDDPLAGVDPFADHNVDDYGPPDYGCSRCKRRSAHPLIQGLCRRCAYPSDPSEWGDDAAQPDGPDARSLRPARQHHHNEGPHMNTVTTATKERAPMNDGMARHVFYPAATNLVAYFTCLGAKHPENHVTVLPVVGYLPCQHTGELLAAVMEPSTGVVFPVMGTDHLENELELVAIRPLGGRLDADEIAQAARAWRVRQAAYRAHAS